MFQRILVPTDGSRVSRACAEQAVAFARAARASVLALYVASPVHSENYGDFVQPGALDRLSSDGDAKAKDYLGFVRKLCKEAQVDCMVLVVQSDSPWEAIVNTAEDHACDLIFMAKHSRSGLSALLIGSQTYRVLANSSIPVLVYRSGGSAAGCSGDKAKHGERRRK